MADTITNTSLLNNLLSTYFERKAMPRLVANAVLYSLCDGKMPLPKGEGKSVVFNAWRNLNPASVTLTEGTNPSLTAMSSRKVSATVAQYARGHKIADLVEYTATLDTLQGAVDTLTDSAALTVDKVIQAAVFKTGGLAYNTNAKILSAWVDAVASAFHAGSYTGSSDQTWGLPVVLGTTAAGISLANGTASYSANLSLYSIRKAVKQLDAENAKRFADGYFKLVANSDALSDLRRDPDFKGWHQYLDNKNMANGEVLTPVEGCRIYMSNNLPRHKSTQSCSLSLIFGQGAYGCVNVGDAGRGFQIIIKRPGESDTSNPANMYGTVSYKLTMAAVVLNPSAGRTLITHDR